ncbi:MAG TPA: acyl-CoA thioesterase II [Saprospiraceae bacterium]|nr:acyl-CoA thioesterase II [Saprospiraceae bacterium]
MKSLLPLLLESFELEPKSIYSYIGKNLDIGSPQIYGGHVLAQAVLAAGMTVEENKSIHSLHSYFLSPGNNDLEIHYEVENIKSGRSFDVRRVTASQNGKTIFLSSISFHIFEKSAEHQSLMPNVTRPEKLNSFSEIFADFAAKFNIKPRGIFSNDSPIIFHPVEYYNPFNPGIRPARNHTWFKVNGEVESSEKLQTALLTYASDFNLLITALMPHGMSLFTTPMQIASIDHAMWFHRPININDWLLYSVESPNLSKARGFCRGQIFSSDGQLLVSVAQEGLIRPM